MKSDFFEVTLGAPTIAPAYFDLHNKWVVDLMQGLRKDVISEVEKASMLYSMPKKCSQEETHEILRAWLYFGRLPRSALIKRLTPPTDKFVLNCKKVFDEDPSDVNRGRLLCVMDIPGMDIENAVVGPFSVAKILEKAKLENSPSNYLIFAKLSSKNELKNAISLLSLEYYDRFEKYAGLPHFCREWLSSETKKKKIEGDFSV